MFRILSQSEDYSVLILHVEQRKVKYTKFVSFSWFFLLQSSAGTVLLRLVIYVVLHSKSSIFSTQSENSDTAVFYKVLQDLGPFLPASFAPSVWARWSLCCSLATATRFHSLFLCLKFPSRSLEPAASSLVQCHLLGNASWSPSLINTVFFLLSFELPLHVFQG